ASVPLIPKFAFEAAKRMCELRNRDTSADVPSPAMTASVFEIVVVIGRSAGACPLRHRGALQELRRMPIAAWLARLARGALGRIAADLRLQLDDVEEDV